ncbi:MAG TPA: hypothetical protein VIT24_03530 [Acidimicrobiales bacterium]
MSDPGSTDADRLLDIELPHSFRGLDPEAVQSLLTDAVGSLRQAQEREAELRTTVASLEAALAEARVDVTAELEDAKRRGRAMVTEAQTVRRRVLEDLVRRRKVLRRQIEQLRVGRERLLEAYEVVSQTVQEATQELGVAVPSAQAAAERAGRRLGPDDDEVSPEDLHAMEAEITAARVAGLPILDPPTAAERVAAERVAAAAAEGGDEPEDPDAVPPLVEVEATVAAFEEMRVLGPVEGEDADVEVAEVEGADADDNDEVEDDGTVAVEEVGPPEPDEEVEVGGLAPTEEVEAPAAQDEAPTAAAEQAAREDEALVLPLFDRLRSGEDEDEGHGSEPAFAAAVDPIEAPPEDEEVDPVAVLADDLARRLRRALADEQNQVLDRLRQDRRGQLGLDELLGPDDARVVRLATAIEPRLREAVGERGAATSSVGDLAARLAGAVADGVRHDIERRVSAATTDDDGERVDLSRPVREAFRAWRTDRILPLAAEVAAESLGG